MGLLLRDSGRFGGCVEMAELERVDTSCCAPQAQADCCAPEHKDGCCTSGASTCGCDVGEPGGDIRERVRERYAAAALATQGGDTASGVAATDRGGREVFGSSLYAEVGEQAPGA